MKYAWILLYISILLCVSISGCLGGEDDDDKAKDATQSDILIEISLDKERVNITVEPFTIQVSITNIASHSVRLTKNYRVETVYTIESPSGKLYHSPDRNVTYEPESMVLSDDESIEFDFVIENHSVKYLKWNENGIYIVQVILDDLILKEKFYSNKVEIVII